MGISDSVGGMANKAKDAVKRDPNRIENGIDEAADQMAGKADEMTGRKSSDKIDKGRQAGSRQARESLDKFGKQKKRASGRPGVAHYERWQRLVQWQRVQ